MLDLNVLRGEGPLSSHVQLLHILAKVGHVSFTASLLKLPRIPLQELTHGAVFPPVSPFATVFNLLKRVMSAGTRHSCRRVAPFFPSRLINLGVDPLTRRPPVLRSSFAFRPWGGSRGGCRQHGILGRRGHLTDKRTRYGGVHVVLSRCVLI